MAKPVIWTVDDDPDVLRAVERDLRRHYGDRYKVISADSGVSALEATKQLKLRNEPIALFLVDQRMPRMSGVEFLEKAIELYPDAKRALLTAYADTDAAIRAINNAHIDHYLMKPWASDYTSDRLESQQKTSPSALVERYLFNPNLDYPWHTLPCLIAIITSI